MKISNSKKQLAKIISENGGWREGVEFAAQDRSGRVCFYNAKPTRAGGTWWHRDYSNGDWINCRGVLPNWHQTILSRDEYFHLYPAPDADGWIEWKGGECPVGDEVMVQVKFREDDDSGLKAERAGLYDWGVDSCCGDIIAYRLHKPEKAKSTAVGDDETNLAAKEELEAMEFEPTNPTIEQLAADYRAKLVIAQQAQEEADSHRCGAEAALEKLYQAGLAIGLDIAIADSEPEDNRQPELVITDWRDLQVGDIIECLPGSWGYGFEGRDGQVVETEVDDYEGVLAVRVEIDGEMDWGDKFKFIRRP